MVIPDAVLLALVGILSGALGFLFRSVMDLRTRVAVLERALLGLERIERRLDEIRQGFAEFKGSVGERLK